MEAPRPVFVGDVQGCAEELDEMLRRAADRFDSDFSLWIVGDVVNRGPDNLRALARVRERVDAGRGHFVLGNHELQLLEAAAGLRTPAPLDSIGDVLGSPDLDEWIEWLRRRPIAATGRLGRQRFAMVHAAVHPDWSLEEIERHAARVHGRLAGGSRSECERFLAGDPASDPDLDTLHRVVRCRSVSESDDWLSVSPDQAPPGHRPWHHAWSERGHDYGLVYGHWSLQGLHVGRGLRGLDTGCVHHGRGRRGFLTAWVPEPERERPFSLPDDAFWQVPARRAYYARKDAT